jgi:hypothetical protein
MFSVTRFSYSKLVGSVSDYEFLRKSDELNSRLFLAPNAYNFKHFLTTKPIRCTNFSNLFWRWKSTCFGQFLCPLSGVIHCTLSNGIRGSFQKFCTLYVFSLKMNLFYKIHLQASNVISIVLYHSGPTFGQVLYSCQDAFVVDASDYSGNLIRHLLNASEAFPTEWFFQFW